MTIKAEYITHSGDDLLVVNAARVSFDKESKWEPEYDQLLLELKHIHKTVGKHLSDRDRKLISYLATHGHWTPFSHPQITLRITAPIFLARQLFKHKVGLTENEISRRYVDSEPEFYTPKVWRKRAENKKQGSSEEPVNEPMTQRIYSYNTTEKAYARFIEYACDLYQSMLDNGTCPEQARMVLPQSMITEWYWTGSLAAFARVYKLRTGEGAQREHELLMDQISGIIAPLFPVSWPALTQ